MKRYLFALFTIGIITFSGGFAYAVLNDGLIAFYPFNGNANEASGNSIDGTEYGEVSYVNGVIGQAASFDGIDDYVYLDDPVTNANPVFDDPVYVRSAAFWFKVNNVTDTQIIYEEGGQFNGLNVYIKDSRIWIGAWSEANEWDGVWLSAPTTTNEWHHVVYIFDSQSSHTFKLYYDGNFATETSVPTYIWGPHTGYDAIATMVTYTKLDTGDAGTGVGNSYYLDGLIDDVRIYNRTLTEAEIQELYNLGGSSQLTVTYPNNGETLYKGEDYTITWNSTNVTGNIQIDLYKGGTDPANFERQLAASDPNDGSYPFNPPDDLEDGSDYYIGISAEAGTVWDFSDTPFTIETEPDLNYGLVAYYPFNGNANDESGNGNDGVVYGAILTEDRFANPNSAFDFNSIDYIELPTAEAILGSNPDEWSYAIWLKINEWELNTFIMHDYYGCPSWDDRMGMGIGMAGPGIISLMARENLANTYQVFSDQSIDTGSWYFATGVASKNTGTLKLYLKGGTINDEVQETSINPNVDYIENIPINIGSNIAYCNRNTAPIGVLDDVRIYNRALTEAEIEELYNLGAGGQLTVTYPNSGETLYKGQDHVITWTSTDVSGNIQIDLYKGGTDLANFVLQLAASDPNDGSYPFNPPDDLEDGSDYYIGISAEAGTIWDFSDTPFTIETPNQPPEIDSFKVERDCSNGLLAVKFTCTAHDPDGEIYSYTVDYGDDSPLLTVYTQEQQWVFHHTYEQDEPEKYNVTCTVEDDNDATRSSGPTSYGENETHSGPIGVPIDSDKDALHDCWEFNGYDHNSDGIIDVDLPAMGADPTKKDVFVEIDYTYDDEHKDEDKPKIEAIWKIVNAFKEQGINLHVDAGFFFPFMDPNDPFKPWGFLSKSKRIEHPGEPLVKEILDPADPNKTIIDLTEFTKLISENFTTERWPVFHYCVFSHKAVERFDPCDSRVPPQNKIYPSGFTMRNNGGFFIVSLDPHTWTDQAGTFMHELGHSLGLGPDGAPVDTYNPNYLSVMNYYFQFYGLTINGIGYNFDYSRFELPRLNEWDLNEQIGLTDQPVNDGRDFAATYGTLFYKALVENPNVCKKDDWERKQIYPALTNQTDISFSYPIDWNDDGVYGTSERVDINRNEDDNDELRSWNDWENLDFKRGGTGAFGAIELPPDIIPIEDAIIEEITEEQIENMKHDYAVSLGISATEVVCPGTTYTHTFTLENIGENPDTYSLSADDLMGWCDLSSLPYVVSLNPGGKMNFAIPINVPFSASPENEQRLHILAISQANENLGDSAEVVIKVLADIEPPEITLAVTPDTLWPPNHKMVPVTVAAETIDNCDPAPVCHITSITSNEPINGTGDGNTAPDWEITGYLTANLRAERAGSGSGRIYTITVQCTDNSGNTNTAITTVTVPHDKGKNKKKKKK